VQIGTKCAKPPGAVKSLETLRCDPKRAHRVSRADFFGAEMFDYFSEIKEFKGWCVRCPGPDASVLNRLASTSCWPSSYRGNALRIYFSPGPGAFRSAKYSELGPIPVAQQ
jgi:hypothetical protein